MLMATAEVRREAEEKLETIEQAVLNGSGRVTREVTRQVIQIAAEALSREKDMELGIAHLNLMIADRDTERAKFDARLDQLRREHTATIKQLSNL